MRVAYDTLTVLFILQVAMTKGVPYSYALVSKGVFITRTSHATSSSSSVRFIIQFTHFAPKPGFGSKPKRSIRRVKKSPRGSGVFLTVTRAPGRSSPSRPIARRAEVAPRYERAQRPPSFSARRDSPVFAVPRRVPGSRRVAASADSRAKPPSGIDRKPRERFLRRAPRTPPANARARHPPRPRASIRSHAA